uniref:Uncharacterized protein n=1 Tax=Tanacetum cinerariifolium TaxID=118510 RepID=A0A6L2LAF3_TANCI|nr:hypothetical protein [Tanacetum cinerariifolium]
MLVPAQEEELGKGSTMPSALQNTQTIIQPSTSKPQKKQNPRKPRRQDAQETQHIDPTTNVEDKALNEENIPTQSNDPPLSRMVKSLEKKRRSRTHGLKRLYKIDLSARVESSAKEQSLEFVVEDVNAAIIATTITAAATTAVSIDDITLAQALVEIKTLKPKEKSIVMQEPSKTLTTITILISSKIQDKGKDRLAEEKFQQIEDENLAWDNVQAMMDAYYELATSSKRARDELDQERSKKQKVEDNKESEELKRCLEIIKDDGDDASIDATPLSIKTLIIDYKIYKEGKKIDACHNGMEMWKSIERLKQDDEPKDQELKTHYMYMAKIQEVILDAANDFGPIFDTEPLEKDDQVFQKERELLASLIDQMKIEINESKKTNKSLESSNKALQEKVTSEKSLSAYTKKIINLNKKLSEMENELSTYQITIFTISFEKQEHEKFYKTHEDNEIEKVFSLEKQVDESRSVNALFVERKDILKKIAEDTVSADFDDSSFYSISEGEGGVHQNISIMVQDTHFEEAAFMTIEVINEGDDEQSEKEDYDDQNNHHAFMFHPGPPTKIADMVQSAGSWNPDKELLK